MSISATINVFGREVSGEVLSLAYVDHDNTMDVVLMLANFGDHKVNVPDMSFLRFSGDDDCESCEMYGVCNECIADCF